MEMTSVKNQIQIKSNVETILTFALIALSVASPILIHSVGLKGVEFLPIFFALTLSAGFLSGKKLLILAALSPTVNMLLTGMPAIPMYYFLLVESVAFASFIILGRKLKLNFYVIAVVAFVLARFSSVILLPIFSDMSVTCWFSGIVNGYKGIIVNIILASVLFTVFKNKNAK